MKITMIGHSTVLIEIDGLRVLTDPYFGRRGHLAYRRLAPPARRRAELLDVDLVLLSHLHWDHVDRSYLGALEAGVPVLVPRRSRWLARLHGARGVVGMRQWEERHVGSLEVTAVPALHLADTVGFVIRGEGRALYFAGDTYARPFMGTIGERFDLDVALMPVTTYRIPMTMGVRGALQAARALRPKVVVPIHLGVAPRSPLLRRRETAADFSRAVREEGLGSEVVVLREGESWEIAAGGEASSVPQAGAA